MSMQSMLAIDARNDPELIGVGTIAIAVDWPSKPLNAASNRQMWSIRVTMNNLYQGRVKSN